MLSGEGCTRGQIGKLIVGVAAVDVEVVGTSAATVLPRPRRHYCCRRRSSCWEPTVDMTPGCNCRSWYVFAGVEWKLADSAVTNHCSELRAGGFDQRRFRSYVRLPLGSRPTAWSMFSVMTWLMSRPTPRRIFFLESGQIEFEPVRADRNFHEVVVAIVRGLAVAAHTRRFIDQYGPFHSR